MYILISFYASQLGALLIMLKNYLNKLGFILILVGVNTIGLSQITYASCYPYGCAQANPYRDQPYFQRDDREVENYYNPQRNQWN